MSTSSRFFLTGTGQQFLACADILISRGHKIVGVLSDCPEATEWCARQHIGRTTDESTALGWVANAPFDYFLSIVNHSLVSPAMLSAARKCAINYHDSLLPAYGGFNATSWAILEGRAQHGVTWHVMTADPDGGPVLVQQTIAISEDDSAFTLGVKCSEAGVATFRTLLDDIEADTLKPIPQQGHRSFHLRSERPGIALLDFTKSARDLNRMVLALDIGSEDNWMSRPKVLLNDRYFTVAETQYKSSSGGKPGVVLGITARGIEVATADGTIVLSGLHTLDGVPADPVQVASQCGVVAGHQLLQPSANFLSAITDFDSQITKSERFWVKRLASLNSATLPGLASHTNARRPQSLQRAYPGQLANASAEQRNSVMAAALTAYAYRLSNNDNFDFAFPASVEPDMRSLYSEATPFRCRVSDTSTFDELTADCARELTTQRTRRTYARDAVQRYRSLRDLRPETFQLSIGFSCDADTLDAAQTRDGLLVSNTHLTLVATARSGYAWAFDEAAISAQAAETLAQRFDVLLAAAVRDAKTVVSALPLLPTAERDLVLDTWQQTHAAFERELCIHQHFEQQVVRTPNATALAYGDERVTYAQLNARANAFARELRALGVGPDVLVGICVERSVEMVVGLLGILKAGGAYVPMDPAYPRDRLAIMLEDSNARVVVTQSHLVKLLPIRDQQLVLLDQAHGDSAAASDTPVSNVSATNLAYVIFTSGSTGRPKGTMLEHRNVSNFFAGMDGALKHEGAPGVWLAVTSISFDISVLELFWTLARGFEVVIAPEISRASLDMQSRTARTAVAPTTFGLFYFAADSGDVSKGDAYRLLIEGAKFADANGFAAVWTPERHFHAFGGLYPNPAVTTAALSTITKRVALRAGSIVLPLHNPLRVAEDWSVIDQLSNGRVGLSFASGWHVNDFAFMPDNFETRREIMLEHIDTVLKLWRGEKVSVRNGAGANIEVSVLPRPIQSQPPIWIASAGSVETFVLAGRLGANVLTNMLGQDLADLKVKFAAYHQARREHGHEGKGIISVMLHTYVCGSDDEARELARKPFSAYLASSFDLVKVAPKMFPAFKQPSKESADHAGVETSGFTADDMAALLEHAFDRYFDTAGLFGTPERALEMVDKLAAIGANDIACLIDFGIAPDKVLASLPHLTRLQEICRDRASASTNTEAQIESIADLIGRHNVTHMQCTPSLARMLASDPASLQSLGALEMLLLGGEALPSDLATQLASVVRGRIHNMYGPTETTVWSTTSAVAANAAPTIGKPIANTTIRVLDARQQLVPVGCEGELYIGGEGVARGYLNRPELTAERFVADPWAANKRMYRTGDLVRYRADGVLEFLGRLDHQVKISGHRIELAEIETELSRHPDVRESVVVARTGAGGAQSLTAYVVPARASRSSGNSEAQRVENWQHLWDEAYRQADSTDPRFRIAGWTNSYSGELIAAEQMREWRDATVSRIRALAPKRVLEIGCGTGLILFQVAAHVDHYTGVDISSEALELIRKELTTEEAAKVTLLQLPAHALDQLKEKSYDLVVINSVVQYFPDAEYLKRVLRSATELVADGGHIFVGDVRSLAQLRMFHESIEIEQASPDTRASELRDRVSRRAARESELVLSEAFFHGLVRESPRLSDASFALRRGAARNEMTNFRYDVVLSVGSQSQHRNGTRVTPLRAESVGAVRDMLSASPALLHLVDVPNARLSGFAAAGRVLSADASDATADAIRAEISRAAAHGVDPDALFSLNDAYEVELRWAQSGNPALFDVALRHKQLGAQTSWPWTVPAETTSAQTQANTPVVAADGVTLQSQWREHLQRSLPDYMIPATFMVLDALPLTPNGKIDRKALPQPEQQAAKATAQYVPPTDDLEKQIADIWQTLLDVNRVGRQDNIFDLGANSLLTMQANNRLSALLNKKVSLVSMFRYPTVASLAAHVRDNAGGAPSAAAVQKEQEKSSRAEQAAGRRRALRAERDGR